MSNSSKSLQLFVRLLHEFGADSLSAETLVNHDEPNASSVARGIVLECSTSEDCVGIGVDGKDEGIESEVMRLLAVIAVVVLLLVVESVKPGLFRFEFFGGEF